MDSNYNLKNYELKSFLKEGEKSIDGQTVIKRGKEIEALGDNNFVEWLDNIQEQIPKEWRKYYLIFPNYTLLDVNRDRRVAAFRWDDGLSLWWVLRFFWDDSRFGHDARFLVPRESLDSGELGASKSFALEDLEIKIKGKKYKLTEVL